MNMKHEKPIWYEPHPVTAERKAELVSNGYKLIDAKFMPHDYVNPGVKHDAEPAGDFDGMTLNELRETADSLGLDYDKRVGAGKLREILKAAFE
jgi:hypothetical protein